MKKELTRQEVELIEAIRNFNNSKHNPSEQLLDYVFELLYLMIF